MKLDLHEIESGSEFEDLVADYFRQIKGANITDVLVQPSGDSPGGDGGRDILVTFSLNDSIQSFKRIWVIQCKFHETPIGKSKISDVNIPSLIHEHGADGYLLICKTIANKRLTEQFENLNKNCKFGYKL